MFYTLLIESLHHSNEITGIGTHSDSTYKLSIKMILKIVIKKEFLIQYIILC